MRPVHFIALALPLLTGCLAEPMFVDEIVSVTENITLDSDVLKTRYVVTTAGVVIDGSGYTINGRCNTDCIGLSIAADNVTVRNVTVTGFDGGVSISRAASGVTFENVNVVDNVQHGIYVDANASNFTCRECNLSDNGAMGIYLEYNTHGNVIENSVISNNGYRDKDTGDWIENLKNSKKDKREGLAIDASQSNVIRNTDFHGNALAAITLYRNCGERGFRREWGASYNTIQGGNFSDDILVAARQDRDLSEWDCQEPYVLNNKFITDDAEFNVIDGVTLEGNARIIIRDDNNIVTGVTGGRLIAHSNVRETLEQPLIGLGIDFIDSQYVGDSSFVTGQ